MQKNLKLCKYTHNKEFQTMVYCAHNRCLMGSVLFTRTLELMYHLVFVFIWVFLGHHTLYDTSRMDCNGKVRAQEKLYERVAWQPQGSS